MTTAELKQFYANLLIMQYNNKPRASATVLAFVGEVVADQIVQQVSDGFSLDSAIGAQLDLMGTYRNAPRIIFGLSATKDYFAMPSYDDVDPGAVKGFTTYSNPNPAWYFILYSDVNTPVYNLSDSELRTLIKYLAELNSSGHGLGELDQILFKYFGTYVTLTDNGDMTITYHDDVADPSNLFKIVDNLGKLPRPAGVGVSVV